MAKKKKAAADGVDRGDATGGGDDVDTGAIELNAADVAVTSKKAQKKAAKEAQIKNVSGKQSEVYMELAARFVLNAPPEELADGNRLLFLVEQAHWYYEDFIREKDASLPVLKLRAFVTNMFEIVPQLKSMAMAKDISTTYDKFLAYKFSIPTCGAVLLNPAMDKCLMVRGWGSNSKSLGFPKGKMDAGETESECAAREVEEEIGVNIRDFIVEEDKVHFYRKLGKDMNTAQGKWTQKNTLFIIQGISEETKFLTHTRKEISDIVWNPIWIFDLPDGELHKYRGKYASCFPGLKAIAAWVKKKQSKQPKPRMNNVIAAQSPAAGRGKTMTLEDLEQEIMASLDDVSDDENDAAIAYEPFSALNNFTFNHSAIMQPFLR